MSPEDVVREMSAAWGRADMETLMKYVADDCVYAASVGPEPGETFVGKAAVRSGFERLLQHDSDGTAEAGEVRTMGDWVVSQWAFRKRGREVRGCDIFTVRDGMVVRKDSFRKATE